MKQANSAILLVFLFAVALLGGAIGLAKGGLYLGKHEVDTLHLIDILLRLADGARIHADFSTPIGTLAFAPIIWFSSLGLNFGMAFLAAQAVLALALVLPLWWIGVSRLGTGAAMLLGGVTLVTATAIVDGQTDVSSSISMYYNRWAWALAFVALGLSMLPRKRGVAGGGFFEGIVIGICLVALALLKVTYLVGIALPVLVGLLMTANFRGIAGAFLAGCTAFAAITFLHGLAPWQAYYADLLTVANSANRAFPSASLADLISAPAFLPTLIVAAAGVIFLRQSSQNGAALLLLIALPGLYYIAYQNFGNDPLWLGFVVVYVYAMRPEGEFRNEFGWDIRTALSVVSITGAVIIAPVLLNFGTSGLRHLFLDEGQYQRVIPTTRFPVADDIHMANIRVDTVNAMVPLLSETNSISANLAEFDPTTFADCQIRLGNSTFNFAIASDLVNFEGEALYVADVSSSVWMFSNMQPTKGSAPWAYGGLPGIENADILVVPKCATQLSVRNAMLVSIAQREDLVLEPLVDSAVSSVYRLNRLAAQSSSN